MRRLLPFAVALVLLAVPASLAAQGQDHAVSLKTLDALVLDHEESSETQRAELRAFLDRPEVREIAADAGIDVVTAESAVETLDDEDVARLATRLEVADAALAGGDTVVISTTAIIIGLLVVIIILVA